MSTRSAPVPQPWTAGNARNNTSSEGELLEMERSLGRLSQNRVTFTGIVSTLLGQQGLHSQCLWYRQNQFDWYWAHIEGVEKIEVRNDSRFRGGLTCVWVVTALAEYAMAVTHAEFQHEWDLVLSHFGADHIDMWPREGVRPDWWPAESAGQWPYQREEAESERVVPAEEELRRLTELLSTQDIATHSWGRRYGPRAVARSSNQRQHNLIQVSQWELAVDGGLKATHRKLERGEQEEEASTSARVKKRRVQSQKKDKSGR
ncbi:hypothetical protein BN14_08415 [Rhizoctonia solani AG-1 IB]|uniref:Uncharacterized protein n=1 Tax=Thanatephorus cucumeris (strain AG1-IB / isolate 7/3/14) TaxID=1108050 RepID=M5C2X6_THACB|nr:hypothetical protein BN14_08415 [Rhizoctonia solani AG-1 IB]